MESRLRLLYPVVILSGNENFPCYFPGLILDVKQVYRLIVRFCLRSDLYFLFVSRSSVLGTVEYLFDRKNVAGLS